MTVAAAPPAVLAFEVEVVGVRRLSPSTVRVTFGGDCLTGFGDGGSLGPRDLRVKLLFPATGHPVPDLGDLSQGWYQRWRALDPGVRGAMRTYTVRSARVAGPDPQIDIDFVLHGDEGGHCGPGSGWAASATPGRRLTVIGPRAGTTAYGGIEWQPPSPAGDGPVRVVLAGDETAVPAISSILATLPHAYAGHALLEVPSAADVLTPVHHAGVEVQWLPRGGRARGERLREALLEVMRGRRPLIDGDQDMHIAAHEDITEVDVDREILWETPRLPAAPTTPGASCYAWVAGEASVVRDLRRLLVRDLGVDRRQVAFMGYWREGRPEPT